MNKVRYRVNYDKAIETIVWLANEKPDIDLYHIAKVLFYADKMHVNKYARPITGDTYISMDFGPVPSGIRDLLTQNPWLNPLDLDTVSNSLEMTKKRFLTVKARRKPKMEYFSESDLECLGESLRLYGDLSFDDLKKTTHDEPYYNQTDLNQPIDYALMVEENNPIREDIIREMIETSPYIQV